MRIAALALIAAVIVFSNSCRQREQPAAAASAPPQSTPGLVKLPPDSPKLSQIRVQAVQDAPVPIDFIEAPGKIEVNPNRVSHIVLPVPGRVREVLVRIGDAVKQGQPLLTMESPEADAAMSAYLQAQASLGQAKSGLAKARADHDRIIDLYEHNAVAKKEVLAAENEEAQAQAAVEQAEAATKQALGRVQMLGLKPGDFGQAITVRAPIPGKVLELSVVPGEYRNDTNAPVMTIADLSTVWVSSDVPESYIRFIQLGERVDVELAAYPGEVLHGRVRQIADVVDPQTRTVKVHAELPNPGGRLRPEMYGRIRHTETVRSVPVVPPGAIVQSEGASVVFKQEAPGTFREVPVKPGKPVGDRVPILQGLNAGDRIVVDGAMLLKAPQS